MFHPLAKEDRIRSWKSTPHEQVMGEKTKLYFRCCLRCGRHQSRAGSIRIFRYTTIPNNFTFFKIMCPGRRWNKRMTDGFYFLSVVPFHRLFTFAFNSYRSRIRYCYRHFFMFPFVLFFSLLIIITLCNGVNNSHKQLINVGTAWV